MNILSKYTVVKIKNSEAYDWLMYSHYAKRVPLLVECYGLLNSEMVLSGVCCYGNTISNSNSKLGEYKCLELVRLVVEENLEKNTLSYFISRTFKMLSRPLVLVSYADIEQNHCGYIYQATNWIYTGVSDIVPVYISNDGTKFHSRSIKHKLAGLTHTDKEYVLGKMGLTKSEGTPKHRYYYFIGTKKEKQEMLYYLSEKHKILPYPKTENKRYECNKPTELQYRIHFD